MNSIYPFQTREVRDLAWACFSPPLLHLAQRANDMELFDSAPTLTTPRRAWLEQLDRAPKPLHDFLLARSSHRLGIYFETLWQFFLDQDPAFELLAHNLQVREDKGTLGEFDCLYFCHARQRHVHLELAVKYFLHSPGHTNGKNTDHHWLGPNTHDRLDLKLGHLLNRQLRLSEQDAAKNLLTSLGIDEPLREVALRGYLFAHQKTAPPTSFQPANKLHRWLTVSELDETTESESYLPLAKQRWLSPAVAERTDQPLSPDEFQQQMREHFQGKTYPLLIASLDGRQQETDRFFVTNDYWPGTKS